MKTILFVVLGSIALLPSFASACISNWGIYGGYGMMGHGVGVSLLMFADVLIWAVVGILAGVWLWQHISKK